MRISARVCLLLLCLAACTSELQTPAQTATVIMAPYHFDLRPTRAATVPPTLSPTARNTQPPSAANDNIRHATAGAATTVDDIRIVNTNERLITTITAPRPITALPDTPRPDSTMTNHAQIIFQRGKHLGNRANVFSKIGDSLTVATYVLYPIGWGTYSLHQFAHLEPVIQYFSAIDARNGNSFANISLAADNGWTTRSALDPNLADPTLCLPGEAPILCEYRIVRPATALILLGTNDVAELPLESYERNMRRIITISIDRGIIPVISTLPERRGYAPQISEFNEAIRALAHEFGIPLWDYSLRMRNLPNGGLSADGVHPSWPPGDFSAAADFSPQNLQYGYTVRNLTALQMLDQLWREVLR